MFVRPGVFAILLASFSLFSPAIPRAQELPSSNEIPIERCDLLPVVKVRIDGADMRFLLDTGATTMLNLKSLPPPPAPAKFLFPNSHSELTASKI